MIIRTMILALGGAMLAGGCDAMSTMGSKVKNTVAPPSKAEVVAMVTDDQNPDRQREGIVLMCRQDWGREEPYAKLYPALITTSDNLQVQIEAVRATAVVGDDTYVEQLLWALKQESPLLRVEAAKALDCVHGQPAVEELSTRALRDESPEVRCAAAFALRHYPQPGVVATLRRALSDPALGVRYRAREALTQIAGRDLGRDPSDWADLELPSPAADADGATQPPQ